MPNLAFFTAHAGNPLGTVQLPQNPRKFRPHQAHSRHWAGGPGARRTRDSTAKQKADSKRHATQGNTSVTKQPYWK